MPIAGGVIRDHWGAIPFRIMAEPQTENFETLPSAEKTANEEIASDEVEDADAEMLPFSARCGEKILGIFSGLTRPASSLLSREQAVVEGVGAAVGRVLLGGVLIGACIFLASLYRRASWGPGLPGGSGFVGVLIFIASVLAAGAILIFSWTDWDRKWRVLSWLCFTLIAIWTIGLGNSSIGIVAVLSGQFAIHWFIHAALRERDRRADWERQRESAERRAARAKPPPLALQYRGLVGFHEPTASDAESRPTPDTGR